jgi:acylphosphatase
MDEEVLHIIAQGRVQGVGFRFHAESVAYRYGVAGWVRNLPGGDVEILARVKPERKAGFLADIRRGPPLSRVTGLEVRPAPPHLTCPDTGFTIRHG